MVLLLDANLSWRLTRQLEAHFESVQHVDHCGLPVPATDTQIWEWAKLHDAVIVTNDDDFQNFSLQKGFPPKIVLLRMGNQATRNVADILIRHKDAINQLRRNDEIGFLEII
jgi:predicted nuclease of predicted toxin-antitoxin system